MPLDKDAIRYGDIGAYNRYINEIEQMEERRNRKTIVRPSIVVPGKNRQLIYVETINVLDSANPNTVTSGTSGTTNTDALDDPGNVKKIALKLNKGYTKKTDSQYIYLIFNPSSIGGYDGRVWLTLRKQSASNPGLSTWLASSKVKVTLITNDFDADTLTWNNYGTNLTLDSTVSPRTITLGFNGCKISVDSIIVNSTWTQLLQVGISDTFAIPGVFLNPASCYGILLEAQISFSHASTNLIDSIDSTTNSMTFECDASSWGNAMSLIDLPHPTVSLP